MCRSVTVSVCFEGNLHLMFEYLEQFKDHLSIHRVNESKDQVFTMFESLPTPEYLTFLFLDADLRKKRSSQTIKSKPLIGKPLWSI